MLEGTYLGAPPVNVRAAGSRRFHFSLMRGAGVYSNAAGGFSTVPALPALQALHRPPASPSADVRMVELYAQQPGLFRERLAQQFSTYRPPTAGHLRPVIPTVPGVTSG